MDFVQTGLAHKGSVRRDFVRRGCIHKWTVDSESAPQHPLDYQLDWQEQHTVAGNSDKERPAFVDNFGTGSTELAPRVVGNHTVAELHTEPGDQAALGKKVGIGTYLASEDQFESGAQPGTENWVELGSDHHLSAWFSRPRRMSLKGWRLGHLAGRLP